MGISQAQLLGSNHATRGLALICSSSALHRSSGWAPAAMPGCLQHRTMTELHCQAHTAIIAVSKGRHQCDTSAHLEMTVGLHSSSPRLPCRWPPSAASSSCGAIMPACRSCAVQQCFYARQQQHKCQRPIAPAEWRRSLHAMHSVPKLGRRAHQAATVPATCWQGLQRRRQTAGSAKGAAGTLTLTLTLSLNLHPFPLQRALSVMRQQC